MGQGLGPLGPGPKLQDTHGECNYLLSGRLPTVRQTTYCQANYLLSKLEAVTHGESNYLLSGRPPTVRQAKTVRHAPNRSIDLHPTTAYMHPRVFAYMHPTTAYFARNIRILCTQQPHTCTQPLHRHAPKIRIHAPKSIRINAPQIVII